MNSKTWEKAGELLRKSRLSTLTAIARDEACWNEAFELTMLAITEERESNPDFAAEYVDLDEATDYQYNLTECLEAYLNHMEAVEKWEVVISSCNRVIELFSWNRSKPSQFMYRKGNALMALGRFDEAKRFGKQWLEKYPNDLYAAASNAYLLVAMGCFEEAKTLTEQYIRDEYCCQDGADTIFMAAYRLYEMTDDINAKQRIEHKIAEYNRMMANKGNF
ncbi:MAG: hypothetical protein HUJ71_04150 [Pseudobutyrivibrio sp.]|nr:hypothetical protein [Pseudobutyrivibrio sp.]